MASSAQQGAAPTALSSSDSIRSLQRESQHKQRISLPCPTFHGRALSVKPLVSQGQCRLSRTVSWTSPINEVAVDGSANAASPVSTIVAKLEATEADDDAKAKPAAAKEATVSADDAKATPAAAKEAFISAVMADVANLVKLVDSRDIVELELKHLDYELVIRKKEALPPPPASSFPSPQVIAQPPYPTYAPPPPAMAAPAPAVPAQAPPPPAPATSPVSDLPRILSPMAGTFYKSPAPGEPPFVKVGDKVQKGQVIGIVEAMKLMNEIESDQSGTVVEILAEDGKLVSVDMPLYTIKP